MLLTELWAEVKTLPHTIGNPWCDPTWLRQHTAAHLVGGAALYLVGGWLHLPPLRAAIVYTIARQGFMREAKGASEFPLYAILWDSATSIVSAILCGQVIGWLT
jgi:hypothetical protein